MHFSRPETVQIRISLLLHLQWSTHRKPFHWPLNLGQKTKLVSNFASAAGQCTSSSLYLKNPCHCFSWPVSSITIMGSKKLKGHKSQGKLYSFAFPQVRD